MFTIQICVDMLFELELNNPIDFWEIQHQQKYPITFKIILCKKNCLVIYYIGTYIHFLAVYLKSSFWVLMGWIPTKTDCHSDIYKLVSFSDNFSFICLDIYNPLTFSIKDLMNIRLSLNLSQNIFLEVTAYLMI